MHGTPSPSVLFRTRLLDWRRGPRRRLPGHLRLGAVSASWIPSATLVRRGGERILVDCGEGTQRQLLRSSAGARRHRRSCSSRTTTATTSSACRACSRRSPCAGATSRCDVRAAGLAARVPGLRPAHRTPAVSAAAPGGRGRRGQSTGRATVLEAHRVAAPRAVPGLGARRARPAGPVRRRGGARARRARGPAVRRLQRGERRRPRPTGARSAGAGRSARPGPGGASCSRATPGPATACWRPPCGPTSSCTRRPSPPRTPSGRARPATRRPPRPRAWRPRPAWRLLALTHLGQRVRPHDVKARGARAAFPATVVPRDFDIIDVPSPERGPPALGEAGPRPGRSARPEPR